MNLEELGNVERVAGNPLGTERERCGSPILEEITFQPAAGGIFGVLNEIVENQWISSIIIYDFRG